MTDSVGNDDCESPASYGEDVGDAAVPGRPPEPDWPTVTAEDLLTYREAENRFRVSPEARAVTGIPDPDAEIAWQELALPNRKLWARVYRPAVRRSDSGPIGRANLPLVLHVHGGGFVGTAAQSDWVNSHLAARLPAVVVSVEHRLLDPDTPLSDAADDGWDSLQHIARHATEWEIDPARTIVFGESCGALICALAAIRARGATSVPVAQVLVNPIVDVTESMFDHASMTQYPDTPTLTVPQLRLFRRLAVPPETDPRALSPLYASDLTGLPSALVLVPTHDPLADHGRRYADALHAAGTPTRVAEFFGVKHAFLSMPGIAPQAEAARAEIVGFLREVLAQ